MKKFILKFIQKVTRLFKTPSQFLLTLEKGNGVPFYAEYYYNLLDKADEKAKEMSLTKKEFKKKEKKVKTKTTDPYSNVGRMIQIIKNIEKLKRPHPLLKTSPPKNERDEIRTNDIDPLKINDRLKGKN